MSPLSLYFYRVIAKLYEKLHPVDPADRSMPPAFYDAFGDSGRKLRALEAEAAFLREKERDYRAAVAALDAEEQQAVRSTSRCGRERRRRGRELRRRREYLEGYERVRRGRAEKVELEIGLVRRERWELGIERMGGGESYHVVPSLYSMDDCSRKELAPIEESL